MLEFIILAYLVFELYSFHSLFEFFVYAATIVISLIEYYTIVYAPISIIILFGAIDLDVGVYCYPYIRS